jgi:hypothetical protein
MAVSIDDLLLIIGSKEAQIFELSHKLNAALKENAELKKAAAALPSNVIPFPVVPNEQPAK